MELIHEQDMTGLTQTVIDVSGKNRIHIELDGISHNYGSYEYCVIRASSDGGSTWINPIMRIGAKAFASQEQHIVADMILTPNGNGSLRSCIDAVWTGAVHQVSTELTYVFDYGVEINALEVRTNHDKTFDNGYVRAYADCACA